MNSNFPLRAVAFVGVTLALFALPPAAVAQDSDADEQGTSAEFRPNLNPNLDVSRAAGPITIDGDLNDPGWFGAARAVNFSENFPEEQGEPEVESEVFVTYDDENLYVAFVAYDDPTTIRASFVDRDEMWQDDYFGILMDTYGDAAWAYFLFANPLGIQGDSRFATAGGEDDGFDIIYYTEARITESGYQIEMAVPFKSLRFPDKLQQTWKVTFWRTRPRGSRETHTWAAIDRDEPCFLCQYGTLTGIEGVRPGGALELLPSFIGSQAGGLTDGSDPSSDFDNESVDGDVSLGIRYPFSAGLTAEGTINPDFSQVESDVGQIDVNTTFALFFPERRPFFQEGSDLFNTFFDVVFTRQINDPVVATKLVGRMGRTNVAYLGARDNNSPVLLPFEERSFVGQAGKSFSNVLRLRQTYLRDSYFGAMLADRRMDGSGSGTTGGVDGVHRFLANYRLEYQFLASHTSEPNDPSITDGLGDMTFDRGDHTAAFDGESYSGWGQYTSLERSARTWNFDFDYWSSSPTFRADVGFETRNDFRRVSMWQGLFLYPESPILDRISTNVFVRRLWNFDGVRKSDFLQPWIQFDFKAQTFVEFTYSWARERFADIEFEGIRNWSVFLRSRFSDPVKFGFFLERGRSIARNSDPPRLGSGTDVTVFATLKPVSRLVIEPELNFSDLNELDGGPELFSGYIFRTRTNLQFTRELFLRLVLQYNDFSRVLSVEPLLTYKVNPFTLFFIGSTHALRDFEDPVDFRQTSRQIFAKFQYLFRR